MIAWLWARTVKSPNPAFASDVDVPLASTFMLSTKKGKEAYVEPVIEGPRLSVHRKSRQLPPDPAAAKAGTKLVARREFSVPDVRIQRSPRATTFEAEGTSRDEWSARLMAVVAEGDRGRVYL